MQYYEAMSGHIIHVSYEQEGRCLEVWSGHVRGGGGQVMGWVMGDRGANR